MLLKNIRKMVIYGNFKYLQSQKNIYIFYFIIIIRNKINYI